MLSKKDKEVKLHSSFTFLSRKCIIYTLQFYINCAASGVQQTRKEIEHAKSQAKEKSANQFIVQT